MSINEIVHKALMAGVGIPEKINELVDDLVTKGELSESEASKLIKECSDKICKSTEDINKGISDLIDKTLEKMNIPTRDEVDELTRKVKSLSTKVRKLEEAAKSD